MRNAPLRLVPTTTPDVDFRKKSRTTPLRRPNKELRAREYLVPQEVDSLVDAARRRRNGHRDATMVLIAYRHGFRACELVDLRWSQIDFDQARLACRRAKKGTPSTHPIQGDTLRALRRLRRESPHGEFVFTGPRGAPLTTSAFAKIVENAGKDAAFSFKAAPAHATARVRLQARQRRPRYPIAPGLPRAAKYLEHRKIFGTGVEPLRQVWR